MPPIVSTFACRDIQEIPREKMVAYAQALQGLTEQNNPPRRDWPCLLVESIAELRKEVGFYLSFMEKEVFWGIDLHEEEGTNPSAPAATTTDAPGVTETPEVPPIPKAALKYVGWDTVVHPSQPVVATGETPSQLLHQGQTEEPFNSPELLPLAHHPTPQRLHCHQSLPHQPEHWH